MLIIPAHKNLRETEMVTHREQFDLTPVMSTLSHTVTGW